jgi:dTDP-4-dehydrorhamnose 3,5-epimerase-like enzyme
MFTISEVERAINPFDPQLAIDWQLIESECKVSDKDKLLHYLLMLK